MGFLDNKKALVTGVASERSIAWGIARARHREGAELAFTYQGEKLRGRVEKMAESVGAGIVLACDVTDDGEIERLFDSLGSQWDGLDILIHSIGFAPREQLQGSYLDSVTREGFSTSQDISAYSLA